MRIYILIGICFLSTVCFSQRDYHWALGDSIGIDFTGGSPILEAGRILSSEEASASISDQNGNLLFYVGNTSIVQQSNGFKKFTVRCSNDSIMPGGDSLAGNGSMTQGLIILPDLGDTNKYYIFHIQWAGNNLYYSIVDMSLNNGLGEIISVNNLLEDTISEKMHVVKAGNGKYWWLLTVANYPNSKFNLYKIDSVGITLISQQPMTFDASYAWAGQMIFSINGDKLLFTGGLLPSRLYDFDRCSGVISNPRTIMPTWPWSLPRYGCSFSPSGRYAYLSSQDSLWQFDTQAPNIAASRQLLLNMPYVGAYPDYIFGHHLLAPDGKIYIANSPLLTINPHDSLNTHLTVIHYPDSSVTSCGLLPFSFSLNGRKSYSNLPNMPNYNLGPMENNVCDSILAVNESKIGGFYLFPNPSEGHFVIEFQRPQEKASIYIYNQLGKHIYTKQLFTSESKININLSEFPNGIYMVSVANEKQFLGSKKLILTK